jgi:coenzyme PQQ precursor peptide PqqA
MMPAQAAARHRTGGGESGMSWETPSFVEVRMDAEVTSYQRDIE